MKTNYYNNIPATHLAADADVEALRRQLEGNDDVVVMDDGTVSLKGNSTAQNKANENKKKMGDVPGGVLGAESLRDILARAEQDDTTTENNTQPAQKTENPNDQKKSMGNVPAGVLGTDPSEDNAVAPEVAAMINEFRSDEEPAVSDENPKKKLGDVPGGVLGMTLA